MKIFNYDKKGIYGNVTSKRIFLKVLIGVETLKMIQFPKKKSKKKELFDCHRICSGNYAFVNKNNEIFSILNNPTR